MYQQRLRFFTLLSLGLCIVVIIIIGIITVFPISEPLPVPVENVFRGDDFLVLRLPPSRSEHQEQLKIAKPLQSYIIVRSPVDVRPAEPSTTINLSSMRLQVLTILRDEWCTQSPAFHTTMDEPVYELGLRCSTDYSDIKVIHIPVAELPQVLSDLIMSIPSPTCHDPFCGWQPRP